LTVIKEGGIFWLKITITNIHMINYLTLSELNVFP